MKTARGRLWHLPRLAMILWAFTRATPWLPRVRSHWDDLRALARVIRWGWVRVIREQGRVAGFLVRDGDILHALYVHPVLRGQGFGRALLAEAKAEAGVLRLWVVEANSAARAFYARQGFVEAARSAGLGNDEGLPDILMVWRGEGVSA
ncbi:GNAT family N-acetyltransferase [Roseovarius mucosus]|uniref:GNAT family N-acetyltransferase n=1 Tax=Roseovarius mucosus TaxID=215743 RepID=UPI0035CE93B4|tara:strand:+ start:243 stop:689 length:447 start_codon:yes stop_codon:yes gene_type:complete